MKNNYYHQTEYRNWRCFRRLLILILSIQTLTLLALLAINVQNYFTPSSSFVPATPPGPHNVTMFQHAINNAAAELNEKHVVRNLFALNEQNRALVWQEDGDQRRVKALALMSNESYRKHYAKQANCAADSTECSYVDKLEAHAPPADIAKIWVTLVPQVRQFCQHLGLDDPTFRLKQYLGLDPNRHYQRFMEIWIQPEDIFRPCADPEPDDNACQLTEEIHLSSTVKNIADYPGYFKQLKREAYTPSGAPWTRLGYTYDWAYGQRGVGASEYIITPTAHFFIDGSYTVHEYCTQ